MRAGKVGILDDMSPEGILRREQIERDVEDIAAGRPVQQRPRSEPVPAPKRQRQRSRPARWADAVERGQSAIESKDSGALVAAIDEIEDLLAEYADWLDGIPDSLRSEPTAELLEALGDLDAEGASAAATEGDFDLPGDFLTACDEADLPRGFGRD